MRIATGSLHYSTRRWKSREAGFPWCVSLSGRHTGLADTATRRHNPYGQLFWVASSKALLCSHPHCRERKGHKNTRQVTPWGVLPGGRNLPRFFLWIGTDNHRRTPYGIADGWEIVEMRGIEPRSDVASTGLLRAQFMRTLLFGSGTCINTYTDEPSHVKVPLTPVTRASSSGLLSRCR